MVKATQVLFGPFRLDFADRRVWKGQQVVVLTPQAFTLLSHLIEHPGRLVTKDELTRAVWRETVVSDDALYVIMSEVRRALNDDPQRSQFIKTESKRGYRFTAPLTIQSSGSEITPAPSSQSPTPSAISDTWQLPTGFVGRDTESQKLHILLDKALTGERQLVFLTGEPGIGKTTLARAFLKEVAVRGRAAVGRGQCIEQYGAGEAYLPVLEALGRLCRSPGSEFLPQWLWQHAPTWLLQLPSFVEPSAYEVLQRHVQGTTRERMLRELLEAIETLTPQYPLVFLWEDLHWSDYSTLDFLSALARRSEPAQLLVLGTYRPTEGLAEGHPLRAMMQELRGHNQCSVLELSGLQTAEVEQYLGKRFPISVLPARLASVLQQRTEGNPLFLVNLVNDLIEQKLFVQGEGGWAFQGSLETIALQIPETSRQLIMRQMDCLTPQAAQTLEAASVAGAEFSAAAVAAALQADVEGIEKHCDTLVRREEFLRRAGLSEWPDGTQTTRYAFRHALYQELWHERVPIQRRQQFHLAIGERLEAAYGNRAREIATELAVHFEQGHDSQRAIQYYQSAAETATQRHAYQEAIAHFTAALTLLKNLPETTARHQRELQLQHSLHWMIGRSKGEAASEIDDVAARERELLQWSEETPQVFGAVFGLFDFYLVRGELSSVRFFAEYALRLARRFPEEPLLGAASMMMGICDFLAGELLSARTSLEQGMAVYTQSQTEASLFWETGLGCFLYAALTSWHLGFPDQALHRVSEAITRARTCDARFLEAWGLNYLAWVQILRGDVAAVRTHATAALQLAEAQGFASMQEAGRIYRGWALSMQEDDHEGTLQIRQGIAALRSTSGITFRTYYLALLAEAYQKTGQIEEGLSVLAEALTLLVDKMGERFYEAELYRLKGELLLTQLRLQGSASNLLTSPKQVSGKSKASQGKVAVPSVQSPMAKAQSEAEECFLKAIDIARRQQAKSLELRATMSLARLWKQQGKHHEARTTLSALYNWFTEGFDTADLQEATMLLNELH